MLSLVCVGEMVVFMFLCVRMTSMCLCVQAPMGIVCMCVQADALKCTTRACGCTGFYRCVVYVRCVCVCLYVRVCM